METEVIYHYKNGKLISIFTYTKSANYETINRRAV